MTVYQGNCLDVLATLPDCSVDAVVTDPPYDLTSGKKGGTAAGGFMGKSWDATGVAFKPETWAECLRVLKPGGHLLAFGGSRTWHRLAAAVEDAGFELRDSIAWLYGSGFPKSLDVSKAIDKAAGNEREVVGEGRWAGVRGVSRAATQGASNGGTQGGYNMKSAPDETAPATPDAERWQGWGTALKPAFEPIVVARKPLVGTVAANVQQHGTGALNIDACRVPGITRQWTAPRGMGYHGGTNAGLVPAVECSAGRWPTNVVLDESQADLLDQQTGTLTSGAPAVIRASGSDQKGNVSATYGAESRPSGTVMVGYGDSGGPSRFFPTFLYQAKAPPSERPVGVDGTRHPTVKPLQLMCWLVRLVTPPGGLVLDPFAGSGTTLEACVAEGFRCVGIETEADYLPLIRQRLVKVKQPGFEFDDLAA